MKRFRTLSTVILFLCIFFHGNETFATSIIVPATVTSNLHNNLPVKYLNASEFVKLSARDFSSLSGIKLNLFQRLSFGITKLRIKHDLKKSPDLKITDYKSINEKGRKFNLLWFILGMAGPAIGVAFGSLPLFGLVAITTMVSAYVIKDKNKIRSAWLGLGVGILVLLLVLILALAALRNF